MGVKIDEAESGIDVALTKRFDLLTKAVATVKGYAKHEEETLTKIIAMRNPGSAATLMEKQEFAAQTAQAIKSFNVVMEQYPNLKADVQFVSLQNSIKDVEEQLQAARRLYNSNVSRFNQSIIVFPASIVANSLHLTKREFFEVEEAKREDVKIEF
jgi:LemA protein